MWACLHIEQVIGSICSNNQRMSADVLLRQRRVTHVARLRDQKVVRKVESLTDALSPRSAIPR
jgi:hypothetical protein